MRAVFKFEKSDKRIDEMFRHDIISRQTLIKRDGLSLGLNNTNIYLVLEGSEEAIKIAREIVGDNEIKGDEGEEIYRKIKDTESEVSAGLGALFG